MNYEKITSFIREIYGEGYIPLHRPIFAGNEKNYLSDCIDSNFVSTAGQKVNDFEATVSNFTGIRNSVAVVNGTSALHLALRLVKVVSDDEVITQALTFVATCNAINYLGANPVFVDVDKDSMGMSPVALRNFLQEFAVQKEGFIVNKISGRRIAACVPMHTFGHPCRVDEIVAICNDYSIPVIEDAAEALGSYIGDKHTGGSGYASVFSFNGNKLVTTGGGGMLVSNNAELASQAKHLTTTAKVPHPVEYIHDEIGYNYRLPNLNAALGCAQMELIHEMIDIKRKVSYEYSEYFQSQGIEFKVEREGTKSNYWLNCLILDSRAQRDEFIQYTNSHDIMTRPIWCLMSDLPMYSSCQHDSLENSTWLVDRVANLPSSVPDGMLGGKA